LLLFLGPPCGGSPSTAPKSLDALKRLGLLCRYPAPPGPPPDYPGPHQHTFHLYDHEIFHAECAGGRLYPHGQSQGLAENAIKYRYAVRNALLPVVTIFMLQLGYMFSGATVIETVFAYPGLGGSCLRLWWAGLPVLQAPFSLSQLPWSWATCLADLMYPLVDPKVRR
jgi:hypothetical protein